MLRLVSSPGANGFMRELLEALAGELDDAEVVDGFAGAGDEDVFAFVPHEHREELPPPDALARTVAIHTEQPGTVWSARAIEVAAGCGAVMDISPVGLVELRRNGLAAELLPLGWTDRWVGTGDPARPVDVTWLASANRRRDVWLATALPWLEPHETRLVCAPVDAAVKPLQGRAKWDALASSKLLLNVRSVIPPYFEWVRALEAIVNGCVYVTEHGAGQGPLRAGVHYVGAAPGHLGPVCDGLLRDPARIAEIAAAATALVRDELPMRAGAERLRAVAEKLRGARCCAQTVPVTVSGPHLGAPAAPETPGPPPLVPRLPDFTDPVAEPPPGVTADDATVRRQLRERTLELRAARRELRRRDLRAEGLDPDEVVTLHDLPGDPAARTTVCIPLYDYAGHVAEAIASVHDQTAPVRLLVLDDASTDGGAEVAREAMRHGTLLQHRVNQGLAATRNAMLARVETPYALMLDADNALFPRAAARLERALDEDPAASFAFGPIAMERDGRPDGLLSHLGWHPELLRRGSWIDALALLRTAHVEGYVDDPRLHGWEDYDLWCTIAERGGHGAFVPQPIARYRRGSGTMLSLSDLDEPVMRAALVERHPALHGRAPAHIFKAPLPGE